MAEAGGGWYQAYREALQRKSIVINVTRLPFTMSIFGDATPSGARRYGFRPAPYLWSAIHFQR